MTPVEEIPEIEGEDKNASLPIDIEIKIDNIRGLIRVWNYSHKTPEDLINEVLAYYFQNTEIEEIRSKKYD